MHMRNQLMGTYYRILLCLMITRLISYQCKAFQKHPTLSQLLTSIKPYLIIIRFPTLNTSHHDARFPYSSSCPVLITVQNHVWFGRSVCWPGEIPVLPATPNSASLVSQAGGISGAKGEAPQLLAQERQSHYPSDTPCTQLSTQLYSYILPLQLHVIISFPCVAHQYTSTII